MSEIEHDPPDDVALIARTVATHDCNIHTVEKVIAALADEVLELRKLAEQTAVRLRLLERKVKT